MATKREMEERARYYAALQSLGFTYDECEQLRRISMTLRRWFEAECNGDIQRDEASGIAYRHYGHNTSGPFHTVRCADRETGAKKRLAAILKNVNSVRTSLQGRIESYIQGDPRGAALYILRPGDVPAGQSADAYYSRGICVF